MSTTEPSTADSFSEFVLWTIAALEYELSGEGDYYQLRVPAADQGAFANRAEIRFRIAPLPLREAEAERLRQSRTEPDEFQLEWLTPDSPLWRALLERLQALRRVAMAQPREPACSVSDIAQRLFPKYQVLGGHMHLGGCAFEDRPFVRLTYGWPVVGEPGEGDPRPVLIHRYFDATGREWPPAEAERLGLNHLSPATSSVPRLSPERADELIAAARRGIGENRDSSARTNASLAATSHNGSGVGELWASAIVWCKYAEGKLSVTIGENCQEFPFAGWASAIEASPLICPQTGERTHELAATQGGVIAAASQIARCSETGERVLRRDLLACSVSGKLALPDRVERCPVSEELVLRSALIECPVCHQLVSPDVLTRGVCRACAAPPRVEKSDARLARLLGEYPQLDQWPRWKLSETATVYIAQARSLFRRMLLVVDKNSLEVLRIATGGAFSRGWQTVEQSQWKEWLR